MTFKKILMFIIVISFFYTSLFMVSSMLQMEDRRSESVDGDSTVEIVEEINGTEVIENMTIYNYKKAFDVDTDGSYEDYYPINTHLTIENETYIYFVPFQNTKLILKLDVTDGSVSLITTETGAITKFYYDRANDKLYYFQTYSIVSYVNLTDDTITDLPTTLTDGGDLGIIEDIFVYDGDVWCIDASSDDLTYYMYDSVAETWDTMGTVAQATVNFFDISTVSGGANDDPYGICFDGTYFYVTDDADQKIYKYNEDLDTLEDTFDISGDVLVIKDICFDGTYFYVVDALDFKVYKYNSAFAVQASYNVGDEGIAYGITWDGTYFYICGTDGDGSKVFKYNTAFSYQETFNIANLGGNDNPSGMDFDGTYFYIVDSSDNIIYRYDSGFNYIIDEANIGALGGNDSPTSIVWSDNFFYVVDGSDSYVYQYGSDLITEAGSIFYSVVIGDDSYVIYQYITGDCKLYKKDLTDTSAPSLVETFTTGYIIPYLENQRGLAVSSDDDTLSFVLKKTSDGLTYFCTYSITDDEFTVGGEFNVSIMLNRNSNESNDPPFNTEKGFGVETDVNDLKVYQIIERGSPTNRLKNIANLTNISDFSGFVIKAITDTYMIVSDGSDSFLATFQSMSSYIYKEEVDYSLITYNHQERNQEFRGVPLAEITYNSDYLYLEKGMFIQIIGTTTILGVKTETDIGFEGYIYNIIDKDKNSNNVKSNIKIARLVHPSYEDFNKSPSGDFTGDTDAYLDDFDDAWNYITKGTYTDGADLGTHTLSSADKIYTDYIVEFGAIDNFIARIRPQGVLDYLDGSDDSTVDYSTAIQKYRRADRSKQYNQITITGAYVSSALITGAAQNDTTLQQSDGIQPLEINMSWINNGTLCNTAGTAVLTLLKDDLIVLVIGLRDAVNGLILPGETITVTFSPRSFTATQMLITRVKYDFKTGFVQYWLSNGVRMEKEDFNYNIPAVNSEHIEQLSTTVSDQIEHAIHDNIAAEISNITLKGTPVANDEVIIEDSADSYNKKSATIGSLPVSDGDAIHDNVAAEISAVDLKATPVDADEILIEDSADSYNKKSITLGTIPAATDLATHEALTTTAHGGIIPIGGLAKQVSFGGISGFTVATYGWTCLNSDAAAYIGANFMIETSGTYSINIVYRNENNTNDLAGALYAGAHGDDQAWDLDNEISAAAATLTVTVADKIYFYTHGTTLSLTATNIVNIQWNKSANEGAGNMHIHAIYLKRTA